MNTQPLTIVTAADASHFGPVQNLCWLLARLEPNAKVILWDLGLTAEQLKLLNEVPPFALKDFTIRTFDFSKYPDYFKLASDFYCFKQVIVPDALAEFGGVVIWMDAGIFFRQPIGGIRAAILRNGVFCPPVSFPISKWIHPTVTAALNGQDVIDKPMRCACIVGVNSDVPAAVALVEKWRASTMNPAVVVGDNYTQKKIWDEAVLSVLLYQSGLPLENNWFGVASCDWMSLREVKFQLTGKM